MAKTKTQTDGGAGIADAAARTMEQSTKDTAGFSLFHLLTLGSIGAAIYLFMSGKKMEGIFVGLWPPTFEALRSSFEED